MKILHVNKFLYRRGGAESYMLDVAEMQRAAGHEVDFFSTAHPDNIASTFSALFPRYQEMEPPPRGLGERARAAAAFFWNREAERAMAAVLDAFQPDAVHLHNIYHHLSPSILRPVDRRHIPSLLTLHDLKLICPTYAMLDKGVVCEACLGGHFTQAVRRRCKDGSLLSSSLMASETAVHTRLDSYGRVGAMVCPSEFLKTKMLAGGIPAQRLHHLPHPVTLPPRYETQAGGPVLAASRLSPEKGLDVLVHAAALLPHDGREPVVEIAGDGPQRGPLEQLAQAVAPGRIRFLGRLSREDLEERMRAATVLVVPSRVYENQPMTILEGFALGVPVVGSSLGGIVELVGDGVDGRLVPPNDPAALGAALAELLADPARAQRMGAAGRRKAEERFGVERHLAGLDRLYRVAAARWEPTCA